MSIVFFTDPHLGLKRKANTTEKSSRMLKDAISNILYGVLDYIPGRKICLGDLFDKYSNDEADILQASFALEKMEICLAGNHDVENRSGSIGSLALLKSISDNKVWLDSFENPHIHELELPDEKAVIVGIPHVRDQETFDNLLKMTARSLKQKDHITSFLILHCNYDSGWELSETSLNLTKEAAEELLETFDYILLGHDHAPSDHFGGRLRVIGNMHPTGFGDISDKRVLVYKDSVLESKTIWDASEGSLTCNWADIPETTEASFVRVTGEASNDKVAEVAKAATKLWKASSDNLLGVKIDVEFTGEADNASTINSVTLEDLPARISEELKGTEIGKLWEELNNAN